MSTGPRLLTPPIEEEAYPYRRVWRSLMIEVGILLSLTLAIWFASLANVTIPVNLRTPVNIGFALLPFGLWLGISWFTERLVPQPRRQLVVVAAVTALAANAIGIPLVEQVFQVDRWLPPAAAVTRILGYTFTVGITQELIRYLVLRYIIWPHAFRNRMDGIAYGLASAVGYVTVLNIQYVLTRPILPDMALIEVFNQTMLAYATSIVVGYGLAEIWFGRPTPLLLMTAVAVAATITGVVIPIRAGLVNASLSLTESSTKPILGIILSAGLVFGLAFFFNFLIQTTERQEREASTHEG